MSIYTELAGDVAEVLEELGRPAVYTRYTVANDLVAGTTSRSPALTQSLHTARVPMTDDKDVVPMENVSDAKQQTRVLAASKGALFRPEFKDSVVLNGEEWVIHGCTPINVDGLTDVVYLLNLVLP